MKLGFLPLTVVAAILLMACIFPASCRRADNGFTLFGGQKPSVDGAITSSAANIRVGSGVTFTVSVINPEQLALAFSWTDGTDVDGVFSGQTDSVAGSSVSWAAQAAGTYAIHLAILDAFGRAMSADLPVEVHEVGAVNADVVSKFVASVDSYFSLGADWSAVTSADFTPTGNPSTGSHGGLGSGLSPFTLSSVYDDDEVLIKACWADATEDKTGEVWTFDGTTWANSGNEDRFYMMFQIADGAGREGKTFAEFGCAMSCHRTEQSGSAYTNNIMADTTTPASACSYCHDLAATSKDNNPAFVHMALDETLQNSCAMCHGANWKVGVGTVSGASDMIAPAGAAFDLWNWAAGAASVAYTYDEFTANGIKRAPDGMPFEIDNATADDTRPQYLLTAGGPLSQPFLSSDIATLTAAGTLATWDEASSSYKLPDGTAYTPAANLSVHGYIWDDGIAADHSANVEQVASYADGTWTVIFRRKLAAGETNTDSQSTDVDFNIFGVTNMAAAYTDNSTDGHRGFSLITLGFGA